MSLKTMELDYLDSPNSRSREKQRALRGIPETEIAILFKTLLSKSKERVLSGVSLENNAILWGYVSVGEGRKERIPHK